MKQDVQIFNLIKKEEDRQTSGIELIASENYVSQQVLEALLANGILGGVRIADDMLLVCVTEQRTKEEMDKFVEIVNNI